MATAQLVLRVARARQAPTHPVGARAVPGEGWDDEQLCIAIFKSLKPRGLIKTAGGAKGSSEGGRWLLGGGGLRTASEGPLHTTTGAETLVAVALPALTAAAAGVQLAAAAGQRS